MICPSLSPHLRVPCELPADHASSHWNKLAGVYWSDVKRGPAYEADPDWAEAGTPSYPCDAGKK